MDEIHPAASLGHEIGSHGRVDSPGQQGEDASRGSDRQSAGAPDLLTKEEGGGRSQIQIERDVWLPQVHCTPGGLVTNALPELRGQFGRGKGEEFVPPIYAHAERLARAELGPSQAHHLPLQLSQFTLFGFRCETTGGQPKGCAHPGDPKDFLQAAQNGTGVNLGACRRNLDREEPDPVDHRPAQPKRPQLYSDIPPQLAPEHRLIPAFQPQLAEVDKDGARRRPGLFRQLSRAKGLNSTSGWLILVKLRLGCDTVHIEKNAATARAIQLAT
jgi:hypothetical protein